MVGDAGEQCYRQAFLMTVPVVEKCVVMEGEVALLVRPLEPMGGLGVNMAAENVPVVYGGEGRLAELRARRSRGGWWCWRWAGKVHQGGNGARGWGRRGLFFWGMRQTTNVALLNKTTSIPLGLPRFYCDDGATVKRLRAGTVGALSVQVRTVWEERRLENVIAVIPARMAGTGTAGGADGKWVILQARGDGSSAVMGRAPGGTQAMNAGMLMDVAEAAAKLPAHAGVVCVWTAGDEWNNRGTREFLDLVQRGLRDPGKAAGILRQRAAEVDHARIKAEQIRDGVKRVAELPWDAAVGGEGISDSAKSVIEEELLRRSSGVEGDLERGAGGGKSGGGRAGGTEAREGGIADGDRGGDGTHGGALGIDSPEMGRVRAAARSALAAMGEGCGAAARGGGCADAVGGDSRGDGEPRDPLLFLSLALTAEKGDYVLQPAVGFLAKSAYSSGLDITGKMALFAQAFRRYGTAMGEAGAARFVPESMDSAYTLETFFPGGRVGFGSDAAIARGQPAAAIATVYERGRFLDTPNDWLENIDWQRAAAQEETVRRLLLGGPGGAVGMLTDPQFDARVVVDASVADQEVTVFEPAIGETLPRLHAAEALVGGESEIYQHPMGEPLAGTRRLDWYLTHADGTATFGSALNVLEAEVRLQAYEFDPSGRPRMALLANQAELHGWAASFSANVDRPVRAMVFECDRLDAYGLFDPRYLDPLEQIQVLDARRLDEAGESNAYARQGMAAVFMPPAGEHARRGDSIQWQVLASRGNVSNRMILIDADTEHPRGAGFDTTDLGKIGPLAWRTAQDFYALDGRRKADLEKFGISNEVIRELQMESETQLAAGQEAEARRDYPAFFSAADAAVEPAIAGIPESDPDVERDHHGRDFSAAGGHSVFLFS